MSLVCGTNKIAWAHVDRGMMVQDWQQVECPNFLKGTYMASAYLNDVSIAVSVVKILITFNDPDVTMYTLYQRFNLAAKPLLIWTPDLKKCAHDHFPCVY